MAQPVPAGAVPLQALKFSLTRKIPQIIPVLTETVRTGSKSTLPPSLIPTTPAPAKSNLHQPAKVIDSLREHAAASKNLSNLSGETGKSALESNFMSAASLADGGVIPPAVGDAANVQPKDKRPLLERMLERVKLDDRGKADEKQALETAFKRLLATPTGKHYAEEFLAEGINARIQFDDFADSQLFLVENRKKFFAAQAYTDWKEDASVVVRLNRHYVDGDAEYMYESLPSIIGHELLGHGLWYGRAAKHALYLAFHYHELNETMARLVGWAIDHELDGKFEDPGAWNFAQDPAQYLANLKLRQAYYAVTFSEREMADPIGTLRSRVEPAKAEIERAKRNLASQKTWTPVLDHFTQEHGIAAHRFTLLRQELADQEAYHAAEIVNSQTVVDEVSRLIERLDAETDRASETYLRQASVNALFEHLRTDTERMMRLVAQLASSAYVPPRPPGPRPPDQITWQEFVQMYQDDVAADAKRAHKHWR